MKILFDHQKFSLQRYGGISRYFANLNTALNTQPDIKSQIAALYSENEYVKNEPFILNNSLGEKILSGKPQKIYKWNRRFSRWSVRLGKYDVFHPTYYDTDFLKDIRKPFVVTVHDMVYELFPDNFSDAAEVIAKKQAIITRADAIIAISEYTKRDILRIFPDLESKIHVVHHGYILGTGKSGPPLQLPEKFILFVGQRWHYKNFEGFAAAISPLFQQDTQLKLICAGGGAFTRSEQELLQQLNIVDQCIQINASDSDLKQLYQHAQLFAYPSQQEGFGLPILEAFANNCPLVCSNNTSMPEVAGNAAEYFDPFDSASMLLAVDKVLNDTSYQQQLKARGIEQLKLFSFDNCVANTIKVYQSLV
ncbi:glycosyltransferase family 4 protein [Mucilaginibacter sp. AW1-3]